MDKWMQIDVKQVDEQTTTCNLYADGRCVKVEMRTDDYMLLKNDGFFIRPGTERDSAGVLNTSDTYSLNKEIS